LTALAAGPAAQFARKFFMENDDACNRRYGQCRVSIRIKTNYRVSFVQKCAFDFTSEMSALLAGFQLGFYRESANKRSTSRRGCVTEALQAAGAEHGRHGF